MANNASTKRFWAQLIGVLSTIGICTLSAFVDYILTRGISTALWIGSAVIIALIVPNWIYNWQAITQTDRNLRERLSRLVANTCSGSVVDIALIFVFLIYTAQISAAINDAIVNHSPWWRPLKCSLQDCRTSPIPSKAMKNLQISTLPFFPSRNFTILSNWWC